MDAAEGLGGRDDDVVREEVDLRRWEVSEARRADERKGTYESEDGRCERVAGRAKGDREEGCDLRAELGEGEVPRIARLGDEDVGRVVGGVLVVHRASVLLAAVSDAPERRGGRAVDVEPEGSEGRIADVDLAFRLRSSSKSSCSG